MPTHEHWMARAIEISRGGFPPPNPHVGCVIVKDGKMVGEGFHHYAGGNHAEVEALNVAGPLAEGADVYVTLEPCNHQGRTSACSLSLIRAKVGRVFFAVADPNPVASRGADTLREAGIPVEMGLLANEAQAANWQFLRFFELGRPVVTVKAAMGLDGRIALPDGRSKWITGQEAREEGHRLRAEAGSVLVGYRTVLMDHPELTARIEGVKNPPVRIVLDPHSKLKGTERVFNDAAETLHITNVPPLAELLDTLKKRKIIGVLVEGGSGTISRFAAQGLVDRYEIFVAPQILGAGKTWIDIPPSLDRTPPNGLRIENVTRLGADLKISLGPVSSPS